MAAHNMCNILRGHVEKHERPNYLHPVDEQGNFPWKKQDSNNIMAGIADSSSKTKPEAVSPVKKTNSRKRNIREVNESEEGQKETEERVGVLAN